MKLVDANVLLYAVNQDAVHHEVSRRWLDDAITGVEPVGFVWLVLIAFLRIATSKVAHPRPLTVSQAADTIEGWLAQDAAVLVEPGPGHLDQLRHLLQPTGAGGSLVNDAYLAALAIARRAMIVSFDNDFDRFRGVRWERPGG
jgi:uncharacterized protein